MEKLQERLTSIKKQLSFTEKVLEEPYQNKSHENNLIYFAIFFIILLLFQDNIIQLIKKYIC